MKKIPTAEDFFEQGGTYPELAIKFAKLHVEQALKEASEQAEIITKTESEYQGSLGSEDGFLYKDVEVSIINKDSILNSYPLSNIK